VWIVLGIGKVLPYSVAALLFVAISLVELVAMPILLLTTSPRPRCCATR
jgi:hypothetical protein